MDVSDDDLPFWKNFSWILPPEVEFQGFWGYLWKEF
jgi:hypothetical protein